jgi:protein required for attachment to host cells
MLDERLAEKAYDRLVIVAPPKALGDLRAALSEQVKPHVYAELDKDLVKTPTAELPQHLGAVMPI